MGCLYGILIGNASIIRRLHVVQCGMVDSETSPVTFRLDVGLNHPSHIVITQQHISDV